MAELKKINYHGSTFEYDPIQKMEFYPDYDIERPCRMVGALDGKQGISLFFSIKEAKEHGFYYDAISKFL